MSETCGICGGDGRIGNSLGDTKTCPGCHGSGRRSVDEGFRDVTKTKPSHYGAPAVPKKDAPVAKPTAPRTGEGIRLAGEVDECSLISTETKAKLRREIIEHECGHGVLTKTFAKKVRKQLRAAPAVPAAR